MFTIVDLKPNNMEELTEVITAAEFHPISDYLFAYGSSKGLARICDTRENAISDKAAKCKLSHFYPLILMWTFSA